jgi:hypothetical protein
VRSLDELPGWVAAQAAADQARLEQVVDGTLNGRSRLTLEQQDGELQLSMVDADVCEGQVVRWRSETLYLSLFPKPRKERAFAWLRGR